MSNFSYWTFCANYGKVARKTEDWYVQFADGSALIGWGDIIQHISDNGWDIIQVIDDSRQTNANMSGGFSWVVRYRFFCRKLA